MPIDYKKYPPNWKTEIRPEILVRANNCCEECGIKNYSVKFIDQDGTTFIVNDKCETYKKARNIAEQGEIADGQKYTVVVLTIAHLDNDTSNSDYSNLKALCQRCHNRLDVKYRKGNRNKTITKKKKLQSLFP